MKSSFSSRNCAIMVKKCAKKVVVLLKKKTYCFFDVLLDVAVVIAKAP